MTIAKTTVATSLPFTPLIPMVLLTWGDASLLSLGRGRNPLKLSKDAGSWPNYKMALIGRDGSILFWILSASTGGEALEVLLLSSARKR